MRCVTARSFSSLSLVLLALCFGAVSLTGCGGDSKDGPPKRSDSTGNKDNKENKDSKDSTSTKDGNGELTHVTVAYVTNGVDPFWNIAKAGCREAEKELNVTCVVKEPANGLDDQKRMLETLMNDDTVSGIAISPINAENQVDQINELVKKKQYVITHDSDAPKSDRLCFIGMHNYKAGRAAGKLVKEAIPDGGEIVIFVGRLDQLNAQQRRQGVIDEVLGRPMPADLNNINFDASDAQSLKSPDEKYVILDTRTDNFDRGQAKSNAEAAISRYTNLSCMVGLFAYNTPQCLLAVKDAGKAGQIKLVSFDEDKDTLNGIKEGSVHGTISQQPDRYGYHSVRILAGLARGDQSVLPKDGYLEVDYIVVKKDNVEAHQARTQRLLEAGK